MNRDPISIIWTIKQILPQMYRFLFVHVEFNRNRETETNKNERITKTNGRSMKHRNADNGIISTFVKLSFLSLSVMRQI